MNIDLRETILNTDRLKLRPFCLTDLADFNAYASEPGVGEMAGWRHHASMEESREILTSWLAREHVNILALEHRENGHVIGSLGLHTSWAKDEEQFAGLKIKEVGYALAKSYWGQALMPEAVSAVIEYSFTSLGLDALTCGHFSHNHQSRRVIEKCGFSFMKSITCVAEQIQMKVEDMRYILLREKYINNYGNF